MANSDTPAFKEFFIYWLRLGFINFGGPAGQIAMMHADLVEKRRWIGENMFLRALNFCMLLPGPEAHQLAVYIGWRLHGTAGGLVAGLLFLLPAMVLMFALSWLAVAGQDSPLVAGVFHGVSAAVVAIVAQAVAKIGKKALPHRLLYVFAGLAFAAGQFFHAPFPWIVLVAALGGVLASWVRPDIFCQGPGGAAVCGLDGGAGEAQAPLPPVSRALKVLAAFALVWGVAVGLLLALGSGGLILADVAAFFTKAPFVTFGGAYAVLSYITDHAVQLGWVSNRQMLMGLGLAETTPGPLIMVTQFVGFVAAWNNPGAASPVWQGFLGGLLATFCTFLPSFLFIFTLAPYIEALTTNRRLSAALTGITAAVVGVVLKLAVFFAVNTFFPKGQPTDTFAMALSAACLWAMVRFRLAAHTLVLASAAAGLAWRLV